MWLGKICAQIFRTLIGFLLLQKSDIVPHLLLICLFLHSRCAGWTTKAAAVWPFFTLRHHWYMYIFPAPSCKDFILFYIYIVLNFIFLDCCLIIGEKWKVFSILVSSSMTSMCCCCGNLVSVFYLIKPSKSLKRKGFWCQWGFDPIRIFP